MSKEKLNINVGKIFHPKSKIRSLFISLVKIEWYSVTLKLHCNGKRENK